MRQRTTTPTWSRAGNGTRLQVLIESVDPALAVSDFRAFRAAGIDVALCHGPDRTAAECPLVRDEPCGLYAGADVVLFDQGGRADDVLEAGRRQHPATPVVLRGGGAGGPEGCESLPASASVEGQIGVLRRAAQRGT
jgi:hypothetical protein